MARAPPPLTLMDNQSINQSKQSNYWFNVQTFIRDSDAQKKQISRRMQPQKFSLKQLFKAITGEVANECSLTRCNAGCHHHTSGLMPHRNIRAYHVDLLNPHTLCMCKDGLTTAH